MTSHVLTALQNVQNKQFRKLRLAHGGFTHGKGEDVKAKMQALQVRWPFFNGPHVPHTNLYVGAHTSIVSPLCLPYATQKQTGVAFLPVFAASHVPGKLQQKSAKAFAGFCLSRRFLIARCVFLYCICRHSSLALL
jgi:hypothetical protein